MFGQSCDRESLVPELLIQPVGGRPVGMQVDDIGLLLQGILERDGVPPKKIECRPHRVLLDDELGMNIQGCQEGEMERHFD